MLKLRFFALLTICMLLAGCGSSTFIGFVSNPVGSITITGTITSVSSGVSSAPSGETAVTVVTFLSSNTSVTLYFCGNQETLFPLNQTVSAEYTSGILCSVLVKVVVVTESKNGIRVSSLAD